MRNFFKNTRAKIQANVIRAVALMHEKRGENFVDSGIKILIAVVIGALLLGGLYALFGATRCCVVNAKRAARTPPNQALTRIQLCPQ